MHLHGVDVGQAGEDVDAVDVDERVAVAGDHQRGHDQVRQAFERRVAGHRLEQRPAPEHAEPQVVANGDGQHRQRFAAPSIAICRSARPRGWLFGPPAGETSTARSMRSGNVVATSTMIGQPSELPTNVARSTPTASQ